jgi:hypothetical protein
MFHNKPGELNINPNEPKNQEGLTSIMVVFFFTIILSLLSIGFANVMNRQLKQTVDGELSSQATYSAESGINDAKLYVSQQLNQNRDPSTNNQCIDIAVLRPPFVLDGSISGHYTGDPNDKNVEYTCVIIDSRPSELVYNINAGQSVTFKMVPYNDNRSNNLMDLSRIFFSWENQAAPGGSSQPLPNANAVNHRLPKESDYNNIATCSNFLSCTGVLEVTIYPIFDANSGNDPNQDANIAQNARTYVLYSNGGAGTVSYASYANNGQFINGNCNNNIHPTLPYSNSTQRYCNAGIDNLPTGPNGAKFYYVRVRAVYADQSVSIQAANSGDNPAQLGSAQSLIDVTGKGNNILKRIATHVPISSTVLPQYTVQSMESICKRFKLPVDSRGPQPAVLDDTASNIDNTCSP